MEKFQNILHDQTERNFAAKKMNTSLMMFPIRLETKIMPKKVDVVGEPEKSVHVFDALANVIAEYLDATDSLHFGNVMAAIAKLKEETEKADMMYKEDKCILTDLTRNLHNTLHTVELQDAFLPVMESLQDVTCVSSISDKASTNFLNEMEKMTRLLNETVKRPDYNGKRRQHQTKSYSVQAKFLKALNHFHKIHRWLSEAQQRVDAIPQGLVFEGQLKKFDKLVQVWKEMPTFKTIDSTDTSPHSIYGNYCSVQTSASKDSCKYRNAEKVRVALIDFVSNKLYPLMLQFNNGGWNAMRDKLARRQFKNNLGCCGMQRYTSILGKLISMEILMAKYCYTDPVDTDIKKDIEKDIRARNKRLPRLVGLTYFNHNVEKKLAKKVWDKIEEKNGRLRLIRGLINSDSFNKCMVVHKDIFNYKVNKKCLCVRIYPDVVALTQATKQLNRAEYLVGKDFWLKYIFNGTLHAGKDVDEYKQSLWLSVCDLYPAHRAAFILKQTFPKANYNVMCRKAKEFHDNKLTMEDFLKEIDENFVNSFPTTYVDNGENIFTIPVTELLPDRFVLRAEVKVTNGRKATLVRYGHRLPSKLQVGFDLNNLEGAVNNPDTNNPEAQLYLNGNLRWMTDYAQAEKMGMAITLPLDALKFERTPAKKERARLRRKILMNKLIADKATASVQELMTEIQALQAENNSSASTDVWEPLDANVSPVEETKNKGTRRTSLASRLRTKVSEVAAPTASATNVAARQIASFSKRLAAKNNLLGVRQRALNEKLQAVNDAREELSRLGKGATTERKFNFSSIYVYGINEAGADECSLILQDLMTAHLYSDKAMDIISFDTPSNILDDNDLDAAFDSSEVKQRERFKHQAYNCVHPHVPEPGNDLDILDRLFCLNESVLGNIDVPGEPASAEVELGRTVNRLMLNRLADNPLIKAIKNNKEIYSFITKDVLPRGPFPMIRIADQPYGILPVCDFRNLKVPASLNIVKRILMMLTVHWNNILANNIINCYGKDDGKSKDTVTTADYLDILNNTPQTSAFYERKTISNTHIINAEYFRGEPLKHQIDELLDIVRQAGFDIDREKLKSLIPDYDFIPVLNPDKETDKMGNYIENNVTKMLQNNDINKIAQSLVDEIKKNNPKGWQVDAEKVEKYVIEFFDLFNYRLDAWLMGMLNNKLRRRMEAGSHRVAIGSFGWLFNLREDDLKNESTNEYILAPSINQAITAAVMRSSYNNSLKNGEKNYDMSVNLSSERVRSAIRIIEGIQNGLSIGNILGADLERLIHEAYKTPYQGKSLEMDVCIYPLRIAYPLTNMHSENDISVINGASLLENYRKAKNESNTQKHLRGWLELHGLFEGQVNAQLKRDYLLELIDRIDDEYDALTDVVLSESVYKLVLGNRDASDALAQALDEMKNIPMPEVVNIPITSAQIDNYMLAMLDVNAARNNFTSNVLAGTEPKVEAWIKQMVGSMDNIHVNFTEKKDDDNASSDNTAMTEDIYSSVTLDELGITASEFVYLSEDDAAFSKFMSLLYWLRGNKYMEAKADTVVIDSADEAHSLAEMQVVADDIRKILSASHALRNEELVKETGLPDLSVTDDLSSAYHNLEGYITRLIEDMDKIINSHQEFLTPETPNYDVNVMDDDATLKVINLLVDSYRIGQINAISDIEPELVIGSRSMIDNISEWKDIVKGQHAMMEKLISVRNDFSSKLKNAKESIQNAENPDYTVFMAAIQTILVNGYKLIPVFQPDENVPLDYLRSQVEPHHFNNIDAMGLESVIGDIAHVEDPVMHLHQMRMFQKCNDLDIPRILPMQLASENRPVSGCEWLGTDVSSEEEVTDAFTYIVMNPERIAEAAEASRPQLAGLVIDHWVERIPYREQTAAVSFAYDQPDAEAPQTILLAVSTKDNIGGGWNENQLVNSLKSAIHMVKTRTVTPDMISRNTWTSGVFPLLSYSKKETNE